MYRIFWRRDALSVTIPTMRELHAIIRGRVQLVMFRDFTQRRAKKLGLKGFVRNLEDGSVEVVAQGDEQRLGLLLQALHRGPLLAHVSGVESEIRDLTATFDTFEISYE